MRDIIELCIKLDTIAIDTYAQLARVRGPVTRRLFQQMGKEENAHVEWWTDLLDAWEAGLVPPVSRRGRAAGSLTRACA